MESRMDFSIFKKDEDSKDDICDEVEDQILDEIKNFYSSC
jgi:hypothetical protein